MGQKQISPSCLPQPNSGDMKQFLDWNFAFQPMSTTVLASVSLPRFWGLLPVPEAPDQWRAYLINEHWEAVACIIKPLYPRDEDDLPYMYLLPKKEKLNFLRNYTLRKGWIQLGEWSDIEKARKKWFLDVNAFLQAKNKSCSEFQRLKRLEDNFRFCYSLDDIPNLQNLVVEKKKKQNINYEEPPLFEQSNTFQCLPPYSLYKYDSFT